MLGFFVAALFVHLGPPKSVSDQVPGGKNEVTVYNQGFGFIKETRTFNLREGRQTVEVQDVPAQIQPVTVAFKSLTDPASFSVLEQNYQYDLISPTAILAKSVGQRIRFVRTLGNKYDVLEGTLLSSPTAIVNSGNGAEQTYNGMVIRADDGRIVLDPSGEVEVLKIPGGLISRPTLVWDIDSKRAGPNTVVLSYLTQGMNWHSDYVLTLDGLGKADLQGWVTIDNQSGGSYENAKLNLLAGDVHVVIPDPNTNGTSTLNEAVPTGGVSVAFKEQSLFEYHLYTLRRPATIRDKETKQLSLLEAVGIPVRKRLIVDGTLSYGRYYPAEGEVGTGDISPQVRLDFVNNLASGLGIPLPKGTMRIYQRDKSGSVQMLGEDTIEHTPKDEHLSLVVGKSFDVRATRRRTNFTRLTSRSVRETFEIEVRNHKDTATHVEVIERSWGDWMITSKSQPFTSLDSNTFMFPVDLNANESKKVTYTIQSTW